jgi:DNA-binding beta-propeller fold protein YncE
MRHPVLAAAILTSLVAVPVAAQSASRGEKGGSDEFGPYQPVANWLKPVREGYLQKGVSVFAETPDHIFVTTSLEFVPPRQGGGGGNAAAAQVPPPRNRALVSVYDRNGNVKEVWTQWEELMDMPHYITISPYDPTKAVWVVSRETDQIFKFSHDGKQLLMTVGQDRRTMPECTDAMPRCGSGNPRREIRQDATHLGQPSALAFLPDGSFYVADGYANRRIVKFDKDGKFLLEFGGEGTGPGQFAANGQVHGIAIDAQRRIYVCDRGNNRVQIFDENGKYLDEWDNVIDASDIKITGGTAWVAARGANRLLQYDIETGKRLTYWGTWGTGPGHFDRPHFMSVDSEGNLYVAFFSDLKVGIEKYVPRADADRARLVGQFVVPPTTN